MDTRAFLEQVIDELEQTRKEIQKLTEENNKLRRQVFLYEKYVKDINELMCEE